MTHKTFEDAGIDLRGKTHGQVKVKCPQCAGDRRRHRSDTPLSVNIDEGVWTCHHCGWTGFLSDRTSFTPQPKRYVVPEVNPFETLGPRGRAFLQGRGIDPDLAAEVGVYSDERRGVLAFPYTKHGEIVHVKYRGIDDKRFWSTKDTELTLYGYDDCLGSDTVLVCEGELDRLAFLMAGFIPTASVPNGAPSAGSQPDAKLAFLDGTFEVFQPAQKVIIATDGDEPGRVLANELVRRIGPEKCWRVRWPEGCKDANDVLMRHGVDTLARIVDEARPEPISGIVTGYDLEEEFWDFYENGSDRGLTFGYPHFDQAYRVKEGFFTVVTGHSSHGKSTALDQLLLRIAERHGWHFAIFSPEQQPLKHHHADLVAQYMGEPFRDGPAAAKMDRRTAEEGKAFVDKHFTYILPEDPSIETILGLAKVVIFRTGAKGLVIDPWNELEHHRPASMNETEYINHALQALRNFARRYNVHLWLVAHPTKMPATDNGEEQIPRLQNISGSIHFRNKADFGLTVFRDLQGPDNPVDIIVTKSRWMQYAEQGKRVRFNYDKLSKRLREVGPVS